MSERCEPPPEWRDRDGRYWLKNNDRELPAHWTARDEWWDTVHFSGCADSLTEMGYRYLAPVTPPAVVAALVEALERIVESQVYLSSAGTQARAALALYRETGR